MSQKKTGKRITVDQLAAMVAKGFLSLEEKILTKEESKNFATKEDVRQIVREEMGLYLDEKLAPIHKKLDNSLYHHEKRIEKLEEKTVIIKKVITEDLNVQVVW